MVKEKGMDDQLRAEDYGLYLKKLSKWKKDKRITVAEIGTDWIKLPYHLICDVPIDMTDEPIIHLVKDQPGLTNAEFKLINGTRVCTFDAEIIERLWKFGYPTQLRTFPMMETLDRYQHAQDQWSFGRHALYELPIRTKVYV